MAQKAAATSEAAPGRRRSIKHLIARIRITPLSFGIAFASLIVLALVLLRVTHYRQVIEADRPIWWLVVLAVVAGYVQYLGYAISLAGASNGVPHFGRTVELEVGESVTTMATPESVGNLALTIPFLNAQGLTGLQAAAATGLSSVGTTLVGMVVLPIAAVLAVHSLDTAALKKDLPTSQWEIIVGIVAIAIAITLLIKIPKLRATASAWVTKASAYAATVAAHPARGALIGFGELVAIAGNVAVLSALTLAVNQRLHLAAFVVIVLLASTASNIVPVPGGLGAPEALLVAGLSSVGIAHHDVLVIALSYRLFTYWLPTIPGALCIYDLYRRDLL